MEGGKGWRVGRGGGWERVEKSEGRVGVDASSSPPPRPHPCPQPRPHPPQLPAMVRTPLALAAAACLLLGAAAFTPPQLDDGFYQGGWLRCWDLGDWRVDGRGGRPECAPPAVPAWPAWTGQRAGHWPHRSRPPPPPPPHFPSLHLHAARPHPQTPPGRATFFGAPDAFSSAYSERGTGSFGDFMFGSCGYFNKAGRGWGGWGGGWRAVWGGAPAGSPRAGVLPLLDPPHARAPAHTSHPPSTPPPSPGPTPPSRMTTSPSPTMAWPPWRTSTPTSRGRAGGATRSSAWTAFCWATTTSPSTPRAAEKRGGWEGLGGAAGQCGAARGHPPALTCTGH